MEKIIIVDYGSQYTRLIARRVRENHVFSEVVPPDYELKEGEEIKGVILSGGPDSVYEEGAPKMPTWFHEIKEKIPVLGVCYGFQLLVQELGGTVQYTGKSEYGRTGIQQKKNSVFFAGCSDSFITWMSHGDSVTQLPEGFDITMASDTGVIGAAEDVSRKFYGLQFHPEVKHTEYGEEILSNFLFEICDCSASWNLEDFVEQKIKEIREIVGDKKVISGFSGGVDSSVASVLVHKAIGDNLTNIFVDLGLLRKDEEKEVPAVFKKALGLNFKLVDAKDEFFTKLEGVEDPEEKRKIIGETFIRVFERESNAIEDAEFLVQGTIYSDVIESAGTKTGKTAKIKSHHNVGGLPEDMKLALIEPLRDLFKDEVRRIGEILGIPNHIVNRQPFPGPGLAVRCLGEITDEKVNILKEADFIFREVLREHGWLTKAWQSFAVLLPVRSVGVVGDRRSYGYTIALRSVDSVEAMTADWSRIPHEILDEASRRITNNVKEVGRVVYDITSKPPATIEWE
ncbi:MAG TPA: glutamine-hydrolyzing GMP synthase [Thermotogota bacterium]|nr:glutamine-hydrolyzing GMP synthase [Thermotogota bacterium]